MRYPKSPLRAKISAAQNLAGKYLSFRGGDFVTPQLRGWAPCW